MKAIRSLLFAALILVISPSSAQEMFIPQPQKMKILQGRYSFGNTITINTDDNTPEMEYLAKQLKAINGHQTEMVTQNGDIQAIKIDNPNKPEGYYQLDVNREGVTIAAHDNTGVFYGIQTLLQLIEEHKTDVQLPYLKIEDYPKFGYRGMHLDVGRHFFNIEEIKNYLEYLAAYKYNKFHWHLTEDQGWRIEIKKYPKLQEISAYRDGTLKGRLGEDNCFDDKRYGGYYTQEEAKEVVAYAQKLHIDVIPEIEMPGHAQAAVAAYPELGCTKEQVGVWQRWGVSENIYCPSETTFEFLEDVIDEIVEIFPYEYIHIGGDEAPKKQWKESSVAQEVIQREGLKDEEELQSYFITRMEKYINSKGRQIIGWDEILEGGLAPNATVMSWTGVEGGIHAAQTGHKAIMTPTSTNYFDYYQGNPESEPLAIGGNVQLHTVYGYNPIDKKLTGEQAQYIWGTQANLWTEYIKTFDHVEYMVFPRMMALAEVAWGTAAPNQYEEFEDRVIRHFDILDRKGINYSTAIFEVRAETLSAPGELAIKLTAAHNDNNIHFTTDGNTPTANSAVYKEPIPITETTTVKAAYFKNNQQISAVTSQDFFITRSTGKKIELEHPPSRPYQSNGASTLVDGIRGNPNNHGKGWLGFNGEDMVAKIDFKEVTEFSKVSCTVIDSKENWIHLPEKAILSVSDDGQDFKKIKQLSSAEIESAKGKIKIAIPTQKVRYLRLQLKNAGTIPEGQAGAGQKAWLFVDEIAVE